MRPFSLNELREMYLKFFEDKGHLRLQSASLIPKGDNSLLLINSGMAPLKKFFTGQAVPPSKRITTCQKCIRTPDIDRVGKTSRHGTYFEMLGNFSFGDYFKNEAIQWAWEFVTEVISIPVDRLWVSIYVEDDEAFDIWTKKAGVSPDRIVRLGKADNFWEHGSGPCGPCSEIYFDWGEEYGCGSPQCKVGCDCDRFIEFWNLVFTQFESDGKGNYTLLANPNIDTGMGLERIACIMQGVDSIFEVDTVRNIMGSISDIAGIEYKADSAKDISLRIITDHIRSITFMIADGVLPSNEGRGYVLRKLLRRAARHGRLLGIDKPFLYKICSTVAKENSQPYPELSKKLDYITKVVKNEENKFALTLDSGMNILKGMIEEQKDKEDPSVFSGEAAFKLYDTYGFPLDLTKEILLEYNITVNEDEFFAAMQKQKQTARAARDANSFEAWKAESDFEIVDADKLGFTGYERLVENTVVKYLILNGDFVNHCEQGDSCIAVLENTPFYAESGGQVGDKGIIYGKEGRLRVKDCVKSSQDVHLHICEVEGTVSVGDEVTAEVDAGFREAVRRNHSATHILHKALKKVLGSHVEQSGSYVDNEKLRFDFTHFEAMSQQEIEQVENEVNRVILQGIDITGQEMPIEQAIEKGATALFTEKYKELVRVIGIGDYSLELCGGTHLDNTAKAGLFKIVSESSAAAGIRRIEAVTGTGVLAIYNTQEERLRKIAAGLKIPVTADIEGKVIQLVTEIKQKEKEIESLKSSLAANKIDGLINSAVVLDGIKIIAEIMDNLSPEDLRIICDKIKERDEETVSVLATIDNGKATIASGCGRKAVAKGISAGNLVKEIAKLAGGSGGGRPDWAMAGVRDVSKLKSAISEAENIIQKMLK